MNDFLITLVMWVASVLLLVEACYKEHKAVQALWPRAVAKPKRRQRRPKLPANVIDFRKYRKRRAAMKTGGNPATA